MTRIIDKIKARRKQRKDLKSKNDLPQGWYYSFEFFPPKTEPGLDNLLTRIDRMTRRLDPLFIDVTWGSAGSTSAKTLAVASYAQRYCGVDVLMHLTTTGMTREQIAQVLQQTKSCGVHNILALRGDPPRGKRSWGRGDVSGGYCDRAIDLVKLIRELHGDYFGIAVAGHPEGHPSSTNPNEEMVHLKQKMDAGADFIVTQFFYDSARFLDFVKRCREQSIDCPIIPGIMPVQSYSSFVRMTAYCGVSVPPHILQQVERVKDDDEAVKDIGCDISVDLCRAILSDDIDGAHFYTLNLERSVSKILMSMGAIDLIQHHKPAESKDTEPQGVPTPASPTALNESVRTATGRQFPWRPSALEKRSKEEVRPINWANRPKSYVMRTEDWDEFPNGRWGDSSSPAFGELSEVSHFYTFSLGSEEDRRAMLGHSPKVPQDVYNVFAGYVDGKVPHIPWCETPLQPESFLIQNLLAKVNRAGFLTINSQPAVNGESSTHPSFGWGGPDGYIYQKAYCEFFCSPEKAYRLLEVAQSHPRLAIYAVNASGDELRSGVEEHGVTALTWGVFPNREILQPTIFDPSTFLVWAEEAFSLWTSMWLNLYEVDSESYELIASIRDSFFLVAIIDNDYIAKDNVNGEKLWQAILESSD